MNQYPPFIQNLEAIDSDLHKVVKSKHDLIMQPGALDMKTKLLILLAVDAYAGSNGVKPISDLARNMGLTDDELREALQISYYIAGSRVLHASSPAFE